MRRTTVVVFSIGLLCSASCSDETIALGEVCFADSECAADLYCAKGGALVGRCTSDCSYTSFCEAHFGERAYCYDDSQCAKICRNRSDCDLGSCVNVGDATVCLSELPSEAVEDDTADDDTATPDDAGANSDPSRPSTPEPDASSAEPEPVPTPPPEIPVPRNSGGAGSSPVAGAGGSAASTRVDAGTSMGGSSGSAGTTAGGSAGASSGGSAGTPADCPPPNCRPSCGEPDAGGVGFDGFEHVLEADAVHRITLVAAADRFFYAVYGVFEGVTDVRIGGFSATDATTYRLQSLALGLAAAGFDVTSPAAMVFDPESEALVVYVAANDRTDDVPVDDVLRIDFDTELELLTQSARKQGTAASYASPSETIGPAAAQVPGGEPFVVWPGLTESGETGLFFQEGEVPTNVADPGVNFVAVTEPVSALSAVHTELLPGAVWLTDAVGEGVQVFAATPGMIPDPADPCDGDTAARAHGLHVAPILDDLWTAAWTKETTAFSAETGVLQCAGSSCQWRESDTECAGRVSAGVKHLQTGVVASTGDQDVLNQVLLVQSGSAGPQLAISVRRIDVPSNQTMSVGSAPIAQGEVDWPELAIAAPDAIGLAWIQAAGDGVGRAAHFTRYRICDP